MWPVLLAACADSGPDFGDGGRPEETLTVARGPELLASEHPEVFGGAVETPFPGPGLGLGDLDGDGWLDLVFAPGTPHAGVLRNDGTGALVPDAEVTMDGGPLPAATSVALADVEGDGDLDVFLAAPDGDRLLLNDGGARFTSILLVAAGHTTTTGAFGDLDGDGDLDLVLTRHDWPMDPARIRSGEVTADPASLVMNVDGAWIEDPDRLPFELRAVWCHQPLLWDLDGDLDLDLSLPADWGHPGVSARNDGYGRFELAAIGPDVTAAHRGAGLADVDGDGRLDVFFSGIGAPDLHAATGDGFVDVTEALGAVATPSEDRATSWGVVAEDLDGDGKPDFAFSFGQVLMDEGYGPRDAYTHTWGADPAEQRDLLLQNDWKDGRFGDASPRTDFRDHRIGRTVVSGDLDRDGRPDLVTAGYVNAPGQDPYLQVWNTGGGWGPGVTVRLEGVSPVGARLVATLGTETLTRWFSPSLRASSGPPELFVGLREHDEVDALTLIWSDGTETELGPAAAGEVVIASR